MATTCELDEERQVVLRAQSGDRAAFLQLVNAYDRRLLYFVRRILGDHHGAFDVLQTVWLTVHQKLCGLKSASAFRVWIYRIAHDKAVAAVRKKSRGPFLVEEVGVIQEEPSETSPESSFDNAELVHAGLQRLSFDHRRILTLRFLEDMKVNQIAEVLGCSDGTVKSRLHHARRQLRRHIEEIQDV